MSASTAWFAAELDARLHAPRAPRARGDRGEGVISVAIAVLIMAVLGAAMWGVFNQVWGDVSSQTKSEMSTIGQGVKK